MDDLSFEVRRGEILGLLGPNGSGKSTTLKILLGLLYPTSGRVEVLGRSPRDVRTKARIGYLPEESRLYLYLTARETLDFYARLFGLAAGERRRRAGELLQLVDLGADADRPVAEFSKGMARRVGLAQALLNDPELLILDEPTSGLDPVGCRRMKDLLRSLARKGTAIVLSSHLLADAAEMCDRIMILYDGRLRAAGRVRNLLRQDDFLRLTVPAVAGERLERLTEAARRETGGEPQIDHPRLDLETFFLQVVRDADGPPP